MLKFLKCHSELFVSMFIILLLSGCATSTSTPGNPLSIEDIPVPPGSQVYKGGAESTVDMMYLTTRRAFAVSNQNCQANTRYYFLPPQGNGLDEYLSFYPTALAGANWSRDKSVDLPGVQRWLRASTKGDQALTLGVIPFARNDSTGYDHILMMVLVTGDLTCH